MGEGFINQGYIVVEKNSILDMKGLSYSMPRLFDYPGEGFINWGPSSAVAFLLIGQDIQYVAYPTTAHSVQFCVATVGTR